MVKLQARETGHTPQGHNLYLITLIDVYMLSVNPGSVLNTVDLTSQ